MLTPEDLKQIGRLHVQIGRSVDALLAGEYRSAFRGSGMEFEEVRPYAAGDDIRRIDWNVTARSGEPFLKVFREERELTMLLVIDRSGSVRFGTGGRDGRTDKRLQIARLAGALAFVALRSNDRVGLLSFSDGVERYLPPRKSRGHGWQVIREAFATVEEDRATNLATALSKAHTVLRRRAAVVVLSDFVTPRGWEDPMRVLLRRHRVHAFMVHDPAELSLGKLGLLSVRDGESGALSTLDASATVARQAVRARLAEIRRLGVTASAVSTADDAFQRLHAHFRGAA
ncbi:MAG: DUF58 domain-containing protein [Deltaproteobacteria bacterium]|nr:DUF58 domain-containing protein [Deltaproteobacteria bacterium]